MQIRWYGLLIPAALMFALAGSADAGGYGDEKGHSPYAADASGGAYRHDDVHYKSRHRGYRGSSYRGGRHDYRRGRGHGARHASPRARHGYRSGHRSGYRSSHRYGRGRSYGYSRGSHYAKPYYRGGITLHFGY
ncbi:MAG: hypothetical protein RQ741_09900 [Wenzhouxiangellaceae bacterium]|nr:hypothetical protein [Wenzhouxiangellaceae bacterium]